MKKVWQHKNMKESLAGALCGLRVMLKTERNARLIFILGIFVLAAGILLGCDSKEILIILVVITSVIICEVINTLVENILDIIKPQDDPHVKVLKDISSAAVLVASIASIIIGLIIFTPKLLTLFKH
ncbi:MAG: diacylglycerol kinase family protein [Candidatus Omnitrophota bacterium]